MIPIYLTDALSDCQQILQSPEENPERWGGACHKLGSIFQGMGWFEEATTWHSRTIEVNPDKLNAYRDLGKIYLQLELWQQAMDVYKQILALNPNQAEAYLYLAHIHDNLGLKNEANDYWYQTMLLQPELLNGFNPHNLGKSFLQKNEIEKALNCYKVALDKNPKDTESYRDLADIFIQQKQWDKAKDCYHNILKINPHHLDTFIKLGEIYLKQKKVKESVESFQQTIKLEPNTIEHYLRILNVLLDYKKWADIIVFSQQAIQVFPYNASLYDYLANALIQKAQYGDAIKVFQRIGVLRDWAKCAANSYEFTEDNFTANISILKEHLKEFIKQRELQALDWYPGEGMTACWFLDTILTHPTARLTCLDNKYNQVFMKNIKKTKAAKKVQKILARRDNYLAKVSEINYDIINLNCGNQKIIEIKKILLKAWNLLKNNGLIILPKIEIEEPTELEQKNKKGIKRLLKIIPDKYELLNEDNIIVIKKI